MKKIFLYALCIAMALFTSCAEKTVTTVIWSHNGVSTDEYNKIVRYISTSKSKTKMSLTRSSLYAMFQYNPTNDFVYATIRYKDKESEDNGKDAWHFTILKNKPFLLERGHTTEEAMIYYNDLLDSAKNY
jgi:hypothetical protein